MPDDKHPLVGSTIVAVRPMLEHEAERCGFEVPFGHHGRPTVLVTRPEGVPKDDTFMPIVVPAADPEGNGPGCLWIMTPPDGDDDGRVFPA